MDENPDIPISDEGDFIDFELEVQAVFKRLAEDIYESKQAGIREPLSNSITAVIQAQERYDVDNPQIEITVVGDERPEITIRDNGIGITSEILEDVLSVIGRSMNRNQGEFTGKYGMGFLACYMLVGTDGAFVMHTRSRKTGESISGLWTPNGFYTDPEKFDLTNPFEENDTYGTQLEFISKEGIERSDVRDWVKSSSEWSRLPVLYREFDTDGKEVYNEDYGNKNLYDPYDGETQTLSVETEYFDAYSSRDSSSNTVLLDSPVSRNYNVYSDYPWNIDVRIKNENGVVVKGPNKGLEPINDKEYEELSDDKRENLMKESSLSENDICVPNPVGTRDSLERNKEFWDWLNDEITQKYINHIAEIASTVTDVHSFTKLDTTEQEVLMEAVESDILPTNPQKMADKFRDEGVSIDADACEVLKELNNQYKVVQQSKFKYYSRSVDPKEYTRKKAWEIIPENEDENVWMACRPTPEKVEVVFEDNENHEIVILDSSQKYGSLNKTLGWKKLGNIGKDTIDEFDVDNDTKEKLGKPENSEERKINIHYRRNNSNRCSKKSIKSIRNSSESGTTIVGLTNKLVVFPRKDEQNVGDYKWIRSKNIGVASCSNEEFEYLRSIDNVVRAKEYINNAKNKMLDTLHGKRRASEIDFENEIVLHLVSDKEKQLIKETSMFDELQQRVKNEYCNGTRNSKIYVPVTLDEMDEIRPLFTRDNYSNFTTTYLSSGRGYDIGNYSGRVSLKEVYIDSFLPNWKNKPAIKALKNSNIDMDNGGKELIESLKVLHDNGVPLDKFELEKCIN